MKLHERIDERLREFLLTQPVFFVGTAPASADGHVNVSPKGMAGTFAVLGGHRVAYLDFTGSGAETIAHLRDNGRIVLMFCAFAGPPNIVRLHGHGRVVLPSDPDFGVLLGHFGDELPRGVRAIIDVQVERVSDSCGFAVPLLEYAGDRDLLQRWTERKNDADLDRYRERKNTHSIDGLPALTPSRRNV
ncbi:pyridoxamine 5'-phosphate oxidase family protein [Saccharomonospora sp. NPDC046836]|uniref:pyridoxamine 5'-phosphate oxidase family protein n=1 Tax=Saccharomonospora sp. NPDC046836 TaxID=3156921 RepID=UPI0033C1A76C